MTEIAKVEEVNVPLKQESTTASVGDSRTTQFITDDPATMSGSDPAAWCNITQTLKPIPLENLLESFVKIGTYTLSSSDVAMTNLVSSINPFALLLANTAISNRLRNVSQFRADMELKMVATFPGNCYGTYCMNAVPNVVDTNLAYYLADEPSTAIPQQCLNTDRYSVLDCQTSEDLHMMLPWFYPSDFFDIDGANNMWSVHLHCIAPMQTAISGGVASSTVALYARFVNPQVLSLRYQSGKKPKMKLSQMASTVSDIALASVPLIGPEAVPVAGWASWASRVLDFFGFSRDPHQQNPTVMALNGLGSITNLDGDDNLQIVGMSHVNSISIDPAINGCSTGEDELAFVKLFDRWTYLSTMTWTSALTSGSSLGTIPIAPLYCAAAAPILFPNTGGYIGLPFDRWRGTMEYLVMVSASSLHRGSIQVSWLPTNTAPPSSDFTNVSRNAVIDITGSCNFIVKVGYSASCPTLSNQISWSGLTGVDDSLEYNGKLYFHVVNPLKSQNSAASVVVTVFVKCSADMQFSNPRDQILGFDVSARSPDPALITTLLNYQSGTSSRVSCVMEPQVITLVPPAANYPISEVLCGEEIGSARAMLQRPCQVIQNWVSSGMTHINKYRVLPFISVGTQDWNWQGHIRILFTAIASSEVYRVVPISPLTGWVAVSLRTEDVYENSRLGTNSVLKKVNDDGALEVKLPYYGVQKFIAAYKNLQTSGGAATANHYNMVPHPVISFFDNTGNYVASPDAAVFYSFGPDCRLSHFRITPRLNILDAPRPAGPPL